MPILDLMALLTVLKENGVTYFKNKDMEIILDKYTKPSPDGSKEKQIDKIKPLTDDDLLYWSANK